MNNDNRKPVVPRQISQWLLAIGSLLIASSALAETSVRLGPLRLDLISPGQFSYVDGQSFTLMGSSEAGTVEAPVTPVNVSLGPNNTSASGCAASDFAGFPAGNIALIQRGTCDFAVKSNNAAAAGASAVLIFNQGDNDSRLFLGSFTMGTNYTGGLPVFFLTYGLGAALVNTTLPVMRMEAPVFRGTQHEAFMRYCMGNRDHCALAVRDLNSGWTRTIQANRPQVTASTYKTLMLIAYAEAVLAGQLSADTLVPRDEWARYSVRRDGGALANAYTRLGEPQSVTIEQMMNVMMRESDNAAPDWLLAQLGRNALIDVHGRHIVGHHDIPISINAYFTTIDGNPQEANPAPRLLSSYAGYQDAGYRQEVEDMFTLARTNPNFSQSVRDYTCVALPWANIPPGCSSGFVTNTEQYKTLLGRFHTRASANAYLHLMEGLLDGSLVSPAVYQLMEPHLEFRMQNPSVSKLFNRYGGKGGSFGPQNVCNWTGYVEALDGQRVVVAAMVRDSFHTCSNLFPLRFMEQIALNPGFRDLVRDDPGWDSDLFYGSFEPVASGN